MPFPVFARHESWGWRPTTEASPSGLVNGQKLTRRSSSPSFEEGSIFPRMNNLKWAIPPSTPTPTLTEAASSCWPILAVTDTCHQETVPSSLGHPETRGTVSLRALFFNTYGRLLGLQFRGSQNSPVHRTLAVESAARHLGCILSQSLGFHVKTPYAARFNKQGSEEKGSGLRGSGERRCTRRVSN